MEQISSEEENKRARELIEDINDSIGETTAFDRVFLIMLVVLTMTVIASLVAFFI